MNEPWLDSTLPAVLAERAATRGDALACTFLGSGPSKTTELSYAALERAACAIGAHLAELFARGDRVLLVYPPGLEFIVAFFGCLQAGIVPATAYPPLPGQGLDKALAIAIDCGARALLTSSRLARHLSPEGGETPAAPPISLPLPLPLIVTDTLSEQAAEGWEPESCSQGELAFLQYTSGSTGDPKGVMITHGNLISTATDIGRGFDHSSADVMVSWLPTFHDMGLIYGVLLPMLHGFPTYLMAPVSFLKAPIAWLEAISEYRGTATAAPNFAFELCLRKIEPEQRAALDLSSWRVAANGAEPVRAATVERFTREFAGCGISPHLFCPSYGLAEIGLKVATGRAADPVLVAHVDKAALEEHRLELVPEGSPQAVTLVGCGFSEIGADIRIVDPATRRECAGGRVGEIWVASSSVGGGYWGRPELSEETFRATTASGDGPFLRTGDLGFFHRGQLFVSGRIKDLVVVRGRNFYSTDLEHALDGAHAALRPGCGAAFGAELDGEERLVIAQEVRADARAEPEEVLTAIRRAISAAHAIKPYAIVLLPSGALPKTSSGKIRRPACRDAFLAGSLPVVARWP